MVDVLDKIRAHQIVAIIRGVLPQHVPDVLTALYNGGVRLAEITLNSPDAFSVIKNAASQFEGKLLIGAGTVLKTAEVEKAVDCGAQYIISPSFNKDVIETTLKLKAVSIPGAYTATEIVSAFDAGAHIIKVFPASSPQYIKDLKGPLNHIPLMPTGGVSVDNIHLFKNAGAMAFGVGSDMVNGKIPITDSYLTQISERAAMFTKAIQL